MGTTANPDVLIFLHIKKTAGNTLYDILRRHYPRQSILTPDDVDRMQGAPEATWRTLRCVQGHMPFGVHERIPVPSTYITFLRDPVDRVISQYYHALQYPDEPIYGLVAQRSLAEFAEIHRNQQTLNLCGKPFHPHQTVTPADLEQAKRNVAEHFSGVGLVERFDESVVMFKQVLGWRNVLYARLNENRRRPPKDGVAPDVLAVIERSNELDIELYELANAQLDAYIERGGGAFRRELSGLQTTSRRLRPLLQAYGAARKPVARGRAALRQVLARA